VKTNNNCVAAKSNKQLQHTVH